MRICLVFSFLLCLFACGEGESQTARSPLVRPVGDTVGKRFDLPPGFVRVFVSAGSFGEYLRNLSLQPHGAKVHYYNGAEKPARVWSAVVDTDVGSRDLQQCADAVIRLRAEHLYAQKRYADIHFNFTSGDRIDYDKWRRGYRVRVNGNKVTWVKSADPSDDYVIFRKYLDIIFAYAGTLSLERELHSVPFSDLQIGDVFIQGGSPGHAVIVADAAENEETGERIFLLAQSYMPAQEIHILQNPSDPARSPWYGNHISGELHTPEWIFKTTDLKRF